MADQRSPSLPDPDASKEQPDEILVARILDGDDKAFTELYGRHSPRLRRQVAARLQRHCNDDEVEEVEGDIWYGLCKQEYKQLRKFEMHKGHFFQFLMVRLADTLSERGKQRHRQCRYEVLFEYNAGVVDPHGNDWEVEVLIGEVAELLGPRDQQRFRERMGDRDGVSIQEATSAANVRKIDERLRVKLAHLLDRSED